MSTNTNTDANSAPDGADIDISCLECGQVLRDYLGEHLRTVHQLTEGEYRKLHPGATVCSKRFLEAAKEGGTPQREYPAPEKMTVNIVGVDFPFHPKVPALACLPLPTAYQFPRLGPLHQDCSHAAISLFFRRHGFIHGKPGTGKDAFLSAISALTRWPALMYSIKPGVNIQGWFFSRSVGAGSGAGSIQTGWERGPLLDALVNGYEIKDDDGNVVERIPYLIVITDFDRADRAQAEHLRMIMDSTQGRVEGPRGMEVVLPGTVIWSTANAPGTGDLRGRCISSNVIDASIMERFERVIEFTAMEWGDEEVICRAKFPYLQEVAPWVFQQMGQCTKALRTAIANETLYADFSHRGVCSVLGHAQDLAQVNKGKDIPQNVLTGAMRVWMDRLGDPVTKEAAQKLLDGIIPQGVLQGGSTAKAANHSFK